MTVRKMFEGEMSTRIQSTTLLQIFSELSLNSEVIVKSMQVADDAFKRNSECEWVNRTKSLCYLASLKDPPSFPRGSVMSNSKRRKSLRGSRLSAAVAKQVPQSLTVSGEIFVNAVFIVGINQSHNALV